MDEEKNTSVREKINNSSDKIKPDVIAIIFVALVIFCYVVFEIYSVTHIDVQTITATQSTVYETIEARALVVRNEQLISTGSNGVTVPCVSDGEKVSKDGNIAMTFASSEQAKQYSDLQNLHAQLDYYLDLQSKSAGLNTDIASIDRDIISDIEDYVIISSRGDISSLASQTDEINDKLTRRQLIIGEQIDFSAIINDLQSQISALSSAQPQSFITTENSGVFSSYVDGCEDMFDYENILQLDSQTLSTYLEQASNAEKSDDKLGKLINNFKWYFCCEIPTDNIESIKDGEMLEVAIKGSDKVLMCTVESGADVSLGQESTVLILSCSDMDGAITSMRVEDIEIRYNDYTGFKVPADAVHINEDGQKCVYALIANTVAQRTGEVIYSTKDYVIFAYDPQNSDSIRMYDQIITKGKDLYDGKIYS